MRGTWEIKKLGDLYKIGSSKRVLKSQWKTEGVPFYRGREVTRLAADGFVENELYISEEDYVDLARQFGVPSAGDIVITAIGTIGNSYVVQAVDRFYFKDASVLWMKRVAGVESDFVNLWLKSPAFFCQLDRGNGATVDTLTIQKLQSVHIDMPPIPEQQRIVALLDEAFAGLATAKANAERNLQNARAIFESHLQSVFSQRGEGWVETTLGDATGGIFTGPFGSLLHKSDYVTGGIPLVNPAHITKVGIEPDLSKTVSEETALRLKSYIVSSGDIVIGRRGEMGRCAVVTEREDGWLCGTGSFFIRPSSRCDTRCLVRYLRSESCKLMLEEIAGGAVMPNLSNTDLGNLSFYLPPLDRQIEIVEQVDCLHAETLRLSRLYERKLAALEELKKSLLHQAFNGEL